MGGNPAKQAAGVPWARCVVDFCRLHWGRVGSLTIQVKFEIRNVLGRESQNAPGMREDSQSGSPPGIKPEEDKLR